MLQINKEQEAQHTLLQQYDAQAAVNQSAHATLKQNLLEASQKNESIHQVQLHSDLNGSRVLTLNVNFSPSDWGAIDKGVGNFSYHLTFVL